MPVYPTDLTLALADVLGTPPYVLHPVWMALREVGVEIKPRYEAEMAAALHFLIPFALEHGDDWRRHAADRLRAMKAAHQEGSSGDRPDDAAPLTDSDAPAVPAAGVSAPKAALSKHALAAAKPEPDDD